MAISQAITIYAPNKGRTKTIIPATISIIPTAFIKTIGSKGSMARDIAAQVIGPVREEIGKFIQSRNDGNYSKCQFKGILQLLNRCHIILKFQIRERVFKKVTKMIFLESCNQSVHFLSNWYNNGSDNLSR